MAAAFGVELLDVVCGKIPILENISPTLENI